MNVYEPCSFSKFTKEDGTGVHGETIARDSLVGGVLLEVDDHLLGEPRLAHHLSMERLRGNVNFGKWHRLRQDGASFFGGRHVTQVDMTRFIKERLRAVQLQRGRCLDRSEPATAGNIPRFGPWRVPFL